MNDRILLNDLLNRLIDDYNNGITFKQHEEDRLVLRRLADTMLYSDDYISVFNDSEKCLLIFVNDRGFTKVLNYDDNFYSVEDNLIAYNELIMHATSDKNEQKDYLNRYRQFIEEETKESGYELNFEYLWHCGVYF